MKVLLLCQPIPSSRSLKNSCGNQRFITIMTEAHYLFLILTWLIQCISFNPTFHRWFLYYPLFCTWILQLVSFFQVFPPVSVCTSPLPSMFHMSRPSNPSWVDHLNNILWGVQNAKFSTTDFVRPPSTACLLRQCVFRITLFLTTFGLRSPLNVRYWEFYKNTHNNKIIVEVFTFLGCHMEQVSSCLPMFWNNY